MCPALLCMRRIGTPPCSALQLLASTAASRGTTPLGSDRVCKEKNVASNTAPRERSSSAAPVVEPEGGGSSLGQPPEDSAARADGQGAPDLAAAPARLAFGRAARARPPNPPHPCGRRAARAGFLQYPPLDGLWTLASGAARAAAVPCGGRDADGRRADPRPVRVPFNGSLPRASWSKKTGRRVILTSGRAPH